MTTYRNTVTGEVREISDQLIAAWEAASNPKRDGWEAYTPPLPPATAPQPRWLDFGIDLALHPGITALWGALPGPVSGALPTALNEASKGNPQLFMALWQRIMATGAITPELIGAIAALAAEHHLPAEFIAGLAGGSQTG
jgi:hypothetical protein